MIATKVRTNEVKYYDTILNHAGVLSIEHVIEIASFIDNKNESISEKCKHLITIFHDEIAHL
jgi:endonuclease III